MTIQELFDQLRREPDWTKKVIVMTGNGLFEARDVLPNLIDEGSILIGIEEE